jgi:hypothetical protein
LPPGKTILAAKPRLNFSPALTWQHHKTIHINFRHNSTTTSREPFSVDKNCRLYEAITMAGADHGGESNDTPEPVIKSFATLSQLQ